MREATKLELEAVRRAVEAEMQQLLHAMTTDYRVPLDEAKHILRVAANLAAA